MKRPGSPVLFVMMIAFVCFLNFQSEHDSCVRSNAVREGIGAKFIIDGIRAKVIAAHETDGERRINARFAGYYDSAAVLRQPLDCGFPFPDTGSDRTFRLELLLERVRRENPLP